jgi:hypothetical protein
MFPTLILAYVFVLFFVLTPGVLVSLPPRASKLVVAATHALVFVILFQLTFKAMWKISMQFEGFQPNNMPPPSAPMNAANMNTNNMPRKN